jgi:cystathionine gamma-lyase
VSVAVPRCDGGGTEPFRRVAFVAWVENIGSKGRAPQPKRPDARSFFETHPKIARVNYPGLESHPQHELAQEQMSGFTGVMSVELRGGYETAERFIASLKLGSYAASLGGFETLLVHPAAMWGDTLSDAQRKAMEVGENLVRISVGLEDERDLIDDFSQALEQI